MTVATVHLLTTPGRHESRALTDRCRGCDRRLLLHPLHPGPNGTADTRK